MSSLPLKPTPLQLLFFFFLISISTLPSSSSSYPLSTVAISHVGNQTVICALVLSAAAGGDNPYILNCTSLPQRTQESYPSRATSYSAIAGGNGFLCALTSQPSANVSTMLWWDFSHHGSNGTEPPPPKRVYRGEQLVALDAGDSHVCGLRGEFGEPYCWRWPDLPSLENESFTGIAVGGNFVCGLSRSNSTIRCFGGDLNVVGKEPEGSFRVVAAGTYHACALTDDQKGRLDCWGIGAPPVEGIPSEFEFVSLALGENRTCALRSDEILMCWGYENFALPNSLKNRAFMSVKAKGSTFCGILTANFALVCWGRDVFDPNPVVYQRVLPGPCEAISSCKCGVVPDYASFCSSGAICTPCQDERVTPDDSPSTGPAPSPSNSTTSSHHRGNQKRLVLIVMGSVGLGIGLVAVLGYFLFLNFCKANRSGQVHDSGRLDQESPPSSAPSFQFTPHLAPDSVPLDRRLSEFLSKGHSSAIEEFPLHVLLTATANFSESHKVGSGSFGSVYRGVLDDGREVAIKRAEHSAAAAATSKRQEDKEQAFLSELALLSRVNHKNLVRLFGFCTESGERVLVSEYMANGTLHEHLHRRTDPSPLATWGKRLRVALDAARGIEYLHRYAVPPVIHRDIKSSNILLDDAWTAKLADFGLSLMGPDDDTSHISLRAAGTVGYMDPEYYRLQYLTTKSDVYSFGVVLLELLSGFKAIHRHDDDDDDDDNDDNDNDGDGGEEHSGDGDVPRNVVDFAVPLIDADEIHKVLDPKLPPPRPCEIEAVQSVGYLAADCVSLEGRDRPTMTEVVSSLERAVAAACSTAPLLLLRRSITARSV